MISNTIQYTVLRDQSKRTRGQHTVSYISSVALVLLEVFYSLVSNRPEMSVGFAPILSERSTSWVIHHLIIPLRPKFSAVLALSS